MDPCKKSNYSYSYKAGPDNSDLCFETGSFGFKVRSSNLTNVTFGIFDENHNDLSYLEALAKYSSDRMDTNGTSNDTDTNVQLKDEELIIEIITKAPEGEDEDKDDGDGDDNKVIYQLLSADETRLWESGMICQHYDFKQLTFQEGNHDDKNNSTGTCKRIRFDNCIVTLYILVWPDSITFTMEIKFDSEEKDEAAKTTSNGDDDNNLTKVSLSHDFTIRMKMRDWEISHTFSSSSSSGPKQETNIKKASLHCNINDSREKMNGKLKIDCSVVKPKQEMGTNFSDHFNCFLLAKGGLIDRAFLGGYTDIRDYDVFHIQVNNDTDDDIYVPILLFVQHLANPTGLCPIVCDMNYEPTGIHMQLSKNWHSKEIRSYGRFYSFLPVKANHCSEYYVRIPYGFYGTLPTASHANLSLIGYHGHGTRWEQLAIGCWGETYCMDMDMGCVKQTVTDIRMLLTKGTDDKKWQWSDAGWGADWLQVFNDRNERLMPFSWKTGYESHGPCLTCMHTDGWYQDSSGDQVELLSSVRTLRTDDYARTFTTLSYIFKKDLPTTGTHFFSMGSVAYIEIPIVAYGCKEGLIEEIQMDEDVEVDTHFIARKELTGSPPWFVGFPGQEQRTDATWGKGFRALIIRKYHATFNNVDYHNPSISLIGSRKRAGIKANLRLALSPPRGLELLRTNDKLSFDVELITLPKQAADYYGPNEDFRCHLQKNQDSWRTIYREAIQNDLEITISGGTLKCRYPIIIVTNDERVEVRIEGGVGALPMRFEGLPSTHYILYQLTQNGEERFEPEVYGNDYWQTDFGTETMFSLTFNIPPIKTESPATWVLRKQ